MKKIAILASVFFAQLQISNAQCSAIEQGLQIKLVQKDATHLSVMMQYETNANTSFLPTKKLKLDGLVFAMSWPENNRGIEVKSISTTLQPFQIVSTTAAQYANTLNKNNVDNVVSFYHDNSTSLPISFLENWEENHWYALAEITMNKELNVTDYYSLLTCEYGTMYGIEGLGNSPTDPWMAMLDDENNYLQGSPKMITVVPSNFSQSSFKFYPVPAQNVLMLDMKTEKAEAYQIKMIDAQGRIVKVIHTEAAAGSSTIQLSLEGMTAGVYSAHVSDAKAVSYQQKIIIQ
jgi:hypothetical protein